MSRPTFVPRYEELETNIKTRMVDNIPETWRVEPGDFMHDAIAANPLEIKQLQANQDEILRHAFPQYAEKEFLDLQLQAVGLKRGEATANKRNLSINAAAGVVIPKGHTALSVVLGPNGDPLEYEVEDAVNFETAGTKDVIILCRVKGEAGNVLSGSDFILQPPIPGVNIITDEGTLIPGADEEDDLSAWNRYDFKAKHPDTGGNRNDYIRWALEVTGVGKVKVLPLWAGAGTVKVVIVDTQYLPASDFLINEVQEYLDPGITGMGDGKAPCGAFVTAVKAASVVLNIEASVAWSEGADPVAVKAKFLEELEKYRKSIVFANKVGVNPAVVFNRIGALLSFTNGVSNYSGLTVNGGTADIAIPGEGVPVIGEVNLWTI